MFFSSFFMKVFLGYVVIVLLLSGFFLLATSSLLKRSQINAVTARLESVSRTALPPLLGPMRSQNLKQADQFLHQLSKELSLRFTLIDLDGQVLIDTDKDARTMENHKFRQEVMEALQSGRGVSLRYSTTEKSEMIYVAIPLQEKGENLGILRASMFLTDLKEHQQSLMNSVVPLMILIILTGLLAVFLFSRNITGPVNELSQLSNRIAAGDFSVRSYMESRNPEIRNLMEKFNEMAKKIGSLFSELNQEKEELDSVISIMKDGLLVLDRENRIVLSNPSFNDIVQMKVLPGKFYWESFRETALFGLVETAAKNTVNIMQEVEIKGRFYLASVFSLEQKQQKLYILQDITESRTLENIKKDFIANVSHELRTPLTAIKGFVETISSEEKDPDKRHYLSVINRHTDRLINIVNDLLVISELEEKKGILALNPVKIEDILSNLALLFQPRAKEKGIQFHLRLPDGIPTIQADGFRLEQVFQNLIDNALKYTDKGEIVVTAEVRQDVLAISVSDSGIGIPEEVLPRIFERFYVVDKSRSRQTGGTGLGLSIVKHIVQQHRGKIEVQSRIGSGSTFTVTLPLF